MNCWKCGRLVWTRRPSVFEEIRCAEPECQADNSITPTFWQRIGWAKSQVAKWCGLFGVRRALVIWLFNPMLLPRERKKYNLPPYETNIRKAEHRKNRVANIP